MRERYENVPEEPLKVKVKDNSVYIKDVFDDARFIDSITRRAAWRIGRDLQADSKSRSDVRAFKNLIMEFINQPEGLIATGFMCAPPLNGKGASILIPVILDSKGFRALTNKEALSINGTFDGAVFVDINGKTQAELPVNGSSGIYGINFYDLQISHCVITKIIESSVINKDHELSIDPELPRTLLAEASPTRGCPKRSPDGALKDSPRQGSEREEETEPFLGVLEIDPSQSTCDQSQLSSGEIGPSQSTCGQSQLSSSITSPRAWKNSMSLNSGVSEDSLKDTENIYNEEPEKQQVTDKSDRKSSDEYSEAKSQDSKSPEKHGGGVQKMKKWLSSIFSKQYDVNLKRHDEGRGTTRSTPETSVTKKLSVSRLFSSLSDIVRAENNSPSKETSPVSSLDGDPGPSQGTISGKGEVLPVEYRSDNSSSKTAVDRDSGFCSTGSPAAQHKGSVSSELKHLQQVKNISEALEK